MYIIGWLNVTSICNLKMDLALKLSKRRHCKLLKVSRSDGIYGSVVVDGLGEMENIQIYPQTVYIDHHHVENVKSLERR